MKKHFFNCKHGDDFMPCNCQNNMSFVDANCLYQNRPCRCKKEQRPCRQDAVVLPEIAEELVEELAQRRPNPCCACNGCSCVKPCCCEDVHIPCKPIDCVQVGLETAYRTCCDCNGICCRYPCCCRNQFWPSFTHPRWLCCCDLYSEE